MVNSISVVILVTGAPAAGKTTLARQLAVELAWPFLYKDGIKELLFDGLGFSDREWSKRLGGATWDLTLYFTKLLMQGRSSFVLEGNFSRQWHEKRLQDWQAKYGYRFFQIHCSANADVLYERYMARIESGERHPGHVDHSLSRELFDSTFSADAHPPLDLDGTLVALDTTDFAAVDVDALLREIRSTG